VHKYFVYKHANPTKHKSFVPCLLGVMPNMLHCQITRSTKFAQHVGINKTNPNPTTNPNPKTLTLIVTLTVTEEINIK